MTDCPQLRRTASRRRLDLRAVRRPSRGSGHGRRARQLARRRRSAGCGREFRLAPGVPAAARDRGWYSGATGASSLLRLVVILAVVAIIAIVAAWFFFLRGPSTTGEEFLGTGRRHAAGHRHRRGEPQRR